MLTPKTSFEIHAAAIQQKLADAKDFMKIGARDDAARLQREIATMRFGGETAHETYTLLRKIDSAVSQIGIALDAVSGS